MKLKHGKLMINYPMIESFKHFKKYPDLEYNSYVLNIKEAKKYKDFVSGFTFDNNYSVIEENYNTIIKQNLDKINNLIRNNKKLDYDTYIEELNQQEILKKQLEIISSKNQLYIINTFCLFPIDYSRKKFEEILRIKI